MRSSPTPARRLLSLLVVCAFLTLALFTKGSQAEKYENGLETETTKPGDCSVKSKNGDNIAVHYKGTLMGGKVFDESYGRGAPIEIELGRGRVIAGWELGLQGMCLGEERTLTIPPALGYGARKMGPIPPDSYLIFVTKMMTINGKEAANSVTPATGGSSAPGSSGASGASGSSGEDLGDDRAKEGEERIQDSGDSKDEDKSDGDDGKCKLLGPFALIVQGGLGVLALLSLVWKRYRERPRRPVKVWFFDVSKQVFGAIMVHFVNLLMSELPGTDSLHLDNKSQVEGGTGQGTNPCSFYLINIAVDTTIGIPILVLLLKVLHRVAASTPLANPPESIKSGHYGQPPRAKWWFKQSIIYFIGLLLMKLSVFLIFKIIPWIALVGDWALKWTEGNEALQITFVMFVFPLIMNGLQYYIIDSFIKDPAAGGDHEPLAQDDPDDSDDGDDIRRSLAHPDAFDEDNAGRRSSADEFKRN